MLSDKQKRDIETEIGQVWYDGELLMQIDNIELENGNSRYGTCRICNTFTDRIRLFFELLQQGKDPRLDIYINNQSIKLTNVTLGDFVDIKKNECFKFKYWTE